MESLFESVMDFGFEGNFWLMLAIVCPLVFLAGFVDSVAGGGGIISLPAYMIAGIPTHMALGTNKFAASIGTAFSVRKYFKGGKVLARVALCAAVGAVVGSMLGAKVALVTSEALMSTIVLVSLPLVAVFMATKKDLGDDSKVKSKNYSPKVEALISVGIGLLIGCYDGLIGPGTGTFMILCFSGWLGLDLLTSSGCAKVANLASNVGALVVFIFSGKVLYAIAIPAALFSILGNVAGANYALKGGSKNVKKMMFVVIGMLFVKIIYDLVSMI